MSVELDTLKPGEEFVTGGELYMVTQGNKRRKEESGFGLMSIRDLGEIAVVCMTDGLETTLAEGLLVERRSDV